MTRTILAALALATLPAAVQAEPVYDRRIDQAAAAIVAAKMGNLRGGFGHDQQPKFTPAIDALPTASVARAAIRAVSPKHQDRVIILRRP